MRTLSAKAKSQTAVQQVIDDTLKLWRRAHLTYDQTRYVAKEVRKLKAAVRDAFRVQIAGLGYSLVEVISNCPTNWGMNPVESLRFIEEKMLPYYPLGDYKVKPNVAEMLKSRAG